jgi:hypothetical protein
MLGPTVLDPFVRPGPLKAGLGCDQKTARIWMQGLGDETLTYARAIGVGGVDEIDSQLHRATQDCNRLVMIVRFSPDPVAGELHCTEPESVNRNITN